MSRCVTLAGKMRGSNVIFAVEDLPGNINYMIKEAGFEYMILSYNEADELIELINKTGADTLVIDSYDIGPEYEKKVKDGTGVRLIAFDDTYNRHECDVLINHNVYADPQKYRGLVPEGCELRCGREYTLIRDEFVREKEAPKTHSDDNINVFVCMGGADTANLSASILKVLLEFPQVGADVLTTGANKNLTALKDFCAGNDRIRLHVDTDSMAKLMKKADFAVVTPSLILNEIDYMGIPFIAVKAADNQAEMMNYLRKRHLPVMEEFSADRFRRKAEVMVRLKGIELINFTETTSEEREMVLEWRNHPDIRKWMFNTGVISPQEHRQFIASLPDKTDRVYYIVKKDGRYIGVIDFNSIDPEAKNAKLGIYAGPGVRGAGGVLMQIIIDLAFEFLEVESLLSEVFAENTGAAKLYDRFGFKETGTREMNGRKLIIMEIKNENRQL